jgi:hypothetical protein
MKCDHQRAGAFTRRAGRCERKGDEQEGSREEARGVSDLSFDRIAVHEIEVDMWDEDPRCQESIYRLLIWSVGIGLVGGAILAFWADDWSGYKTFLRILALTALALCSYAAVIWVLGHSAKWICRCFQKLKRRLNGK